MIIYFTLAITVHITQGYLPGSARLTDSCPEPNNLTAWTIAARKMNCSEYIPANIRNKDLYHCLPSIFFNETIEFCGEFAAIDNGYCPVYDYTNGATIATSRSCKNFTSGCPEPRNPPYHSLQFYLYSECLNISKTARCYHADPSCSKVKHSYKTTPLPPIDTSSESSVTGSTSSEASTPGYEVTSTTRSSTDVSSHPINLVWIFVAILLVVVCVLVVIIIVTCRRKREKIGSPDDVELTAYGTEGNGHTDPLLNGKDEANSSSEKLCEEKNDVELTAYGTEGNGHTDPLLNGKDEANSSSEKLCEEKSSEQKDVMKDHKNEPNKDNIGTIEEPKISYTSAVSKSRNVGNCDGPNDEKNDDMNSGKDQISTDEENEGRKQLDYNAFYFKLCNEIIKRNLMKDLKRLLKDPTDKNTPADDSELLDHWDERHRFIYNIWHLQKLLQMCKAYDLVERCQKFAKEHRQSMELYYFTRTTLGGDREILEVHTSYRVKSKRVESKMKMIQERLSECLDYALDEVRLIGVEHGSLIFVFSLPGVTIQNLKDLYMSKIWKMKVFKIETSHHIINQVSRLEEKPSEIAVQPWNPAKCCQSSCPKEKKMNNKVTHRILRNKDTGSCIWIAGSNIKRLVIVHLRIDVQTSLIRMSNVHACTQAVVQEMHRSFQQSGSNGQVYGNQATVKLKRQAPRASRKKAYKDKFLQNQVLEEMEPNVFLGDLKMKYPMFYKDLKKCIRPGNCRRENAEDILNHLKDMEGKRPKDINNNIIEKYRVASHSEKQSTDDLKISDDKDIVKRKISSQRNDLVEEMDSAIINDTMEELGLSEEKYIELFHANSGKPRRDRATALLDFILVNEDCLFPFVGILDKYDLCIQ